MPPTPLNENEPPTPDSNQEQSRNTSPLPSLPTEPVSIESELQQSSQSAQPQNIAADTVANETVLDLGTLQPELVPAPRIIGRWLLVLVSLYAVGWLFITALPSLTPFIFGLVIAYILLPIVNRLARFMPRWLSILTVYFGAIVIVIVLVAYIAPVVTDQIELLVENFPKFIETMEAFGRTLITQYENSVPAAIKAPLEEGLLNGLATLQQNISTYIQGVGTFLFNQVLQIINTVSFLVGFLIIPIWLFYVLNDASQGRAFVNQLLHRRIRADFWNIWGIIDEVFSNYIRGQLILGVAVGVMVGVSLLGLQLFGFEVGSYILLLAIIAGVTELIPIIGPIIGAIPGVIIGFTVSPSTGIAILLVYVIVQQLENNLLVPRIIGESVGIHAAILTVVLIAMGQVFGFLGIVLAAPISAIARDLFLYIYRRLDGLEPGDARAAVIAHNSPTNGNAKS